MNGFWFGKMGFVLYFSLVYVTVMIVWGRGVVSDLNYREYCIVGDVLESGEGGGNKRNLITNLGVFRIFIFLLLFFVIFCQ